MLILPNVWFSFAGILTAASDLGYRNAMGAVYKQGTTAESSHMITQQSFGPLIFERIIAGIYSFLFFSLASKNLSLSFIENVIF